MRSLKFLWKSVTRTHPLDSMGLRTDRKKFLTFYFHLKLYICIAVQYIYIYLCIVQTCSIVDFMSWWTGPGLIVSKYGREVRVSALALEVAGRAAGVAVFL